MKPLIGLEIRFFEKVVVGIWTVRGPCRCMLSYFLEMLTGLLLLVQEDAGSLVFVHHRHQLIPAHTTTSSQQKRENSSTSWNSRLYYEKTHLRRISMTLIPWRFQEEKSFLCKFWWIYTPWEWVLIQYVPRLNKQRTVSKDVCLCAKGTQYNWVKKPSNRSKLYRKDFEPKTSTFVTSFQKKRQKHPLQVK